MEITDVDTMVARWGNFIDGVDDWETLVSPLDKPDEVTEFGAKIFELGKPSDTFVGDAAIVDMCGVQHMDEPHKHTGGETEAHFVIQGSAITVVGGDMGHIAVGETLVIQPDIPHFFVPDAEFVEVVVSIPAYNPENQIPVQLL